MKTDRDLRQPSALPTDPPRLTSHSGLVKALCGLTAAAALAVAVALLLPRGSSAPSVDPLAAPDPVTTVAAPEVTDLAAVTRTLLDLDYQLRVHPDPAAVARLLDIDNPGYAESVSAVQQLATGDRRYDPPPRPYSLASVEVLVQSGDTATVMVKHAAWPSFRVLDRGGAVVIDLPAGGPRNVVLTLRRRDGAWRISNSERLS